MSQVAFWGSCSLILFLVAFSLTSRPRTLSSPRYDGNSKQDWWFWMFLMGEKLQKLWSICRERSSHFAPKIATPDATHINIRALLWEIFLRQWVMRLFEACCSLLLTLKIIKVDLSLLCISYTTSPHANIPLTLSRWAPCVSLLECPSALRKLTGPSVGKIHDSPRQDDNGWVMIINDPCIAIVCRFLCTKVKLNPATMLGTYFEPKNIK